MKRSEIRKEIKTRTEFGIVEDYLMDLLTVKTSKNPDTRHQARRRSETAFDSMTNKAARQALELATELGLPWKPLIALS